MNNTYHVVKLTTNDNDETVATTLATISADSIATAYATAHAAYGEHVRVFPAADLTNGYSIMHAAEHAVRSYEHWERRNEFAWKEAFHRSEHDRHDLIQTAALAIMEKLTENPCVDMYTVQRAAFAAIRTEQGRHERTAERVEYYDPSFHSDHIQTHAVRPTAAALDRLVDAAIDAAALTADQQTCINLLMDGHSGVQIADLRKVKKQSVYDLLGKAYAKILAELATIATPAALARVGLTTNDVQEALNKRLKRVASKKGKK